MSFTQAADALLLSLLTGPRVFTGRPPLPYLVWPAFAARGVFLARPRFVMLRAVVVRYGIVVGAGVASEPPPPPAQARRWWNASIRARAQRGRALRL
jgi:hypothetical protein